MRQFTFRRLTLASFLAVAALVALPGAFAASSPLRLLTLSPAVIPLGNVAVGSTTEKTVTLTNAGDEPLTLTSDEAFGYNGNFSVNSGTCTLGTTLAPGASCTFTVSSSPSKIGAIRGQFCFTATGEATSDRECGRVVGGAT
jgi:Abnormal spindle-like microcephaly-assoc'd, ASPM-SPD-2-Hydin